MILGISYGFNYDRVVYAITTWLLEVPEDTQSELYDHSDCYLAEWKILHSWIMSK